MPKNEADKLHGDLIGANRALLTAMRRRDRLTKQLAQQEALCDQLSKVVKQLIAYLLPARPPAAPVCSECQHVLGSNKECVGCQEALDLSTGEPRAHPENA
jgi:hypothetical protein